MALLINKTDFFSLKAADSECGVGATGAASFFMMSKPSTVIIKKAAHGRGRARSLGEARPPRRLNDVSSFRSVAFDTSDHTGILVMPLGQNMEVLYKSQPLFICA